LVAGSLLGRCVRWRARAVRVMTPILWKMLRRWVSAVFWRKDGSAAICGLVLWSATSRAAWSSRSVSGPTLAPSVVPGRGAPVDVMS